MNDFKRNGVIRYCLVGVLGLGLLIFPLANQVKAEPMDNPYPTIAISDYVFGCMGSNGQTRDALERCSCSIDVIASIISYEDYERAETVLSLRRLSGEKAAVFKTSARWRKAVTLLRRAQAEAEVRCF